MFYYLMVGNLFFAVSSPNVLNYFCQFNASKTTFETYRKILNYSDRWVHIHIYRIFWVLFSQHPLSIYSQRSLHVTRGVTSVWVRAFQLFVVFEIMCASVLWEHCLGPEKEALVHLSSGLRGRRETNMLEGGGWGAFSVMRARSFHWRC